MLCVSTTCALQIVNLSGFRRKQMLHGSVGNVVLVSKGD